MKNKINPYVNTHLNYQRHQECQWNEWGQLLGFKDGTEMLFYLIRDCDRHAIADLLGVSEGTIRYQMKKRGLKNPNR